MLAHLPFEPRIEISQSLTIDGPGASSLAVSGGGSTEVFDVTAGTVAISGSDHRGRHDSGRHGRH